MPIRTFEHYSRDVAAALKSLKTLRSRGWVTFLLRVGCRRCVAEI